MTYYLMIMRLVNQRDENDLFLILTYNPANPDVKGMLQRYLPIINNSKNLEILQDKNMVLCHRRIKNLRHILVKSRIRYPPTRKLHQISGKETNVCVYTSNIRYNHGPKIDKSGKILCSKTKGTYKVLKMVLVVTTIWYTLIVICQKCHKQYVGETHRTLKERFYEHFYDCKHLSNPLNAPPVCKGRNALEYLNTSVWNHTVWMVS